MCTATLSMVSPAGIPITAQVSLGDTHEEVIATMERAERAGAYFLARGWTAPHASPSAAAGPSAAELAQGPTFAGYPCSPTIDDKGMPTWIIVDGRQAQRRERQGDVWYSIKMAENEYMQILKIPKGEKAPAVQGL